MSILMTIKGLMNRILDLAFLSRMQLLENYDYNDEYDDDGED